MGRKSKADQRRTEIVEAFYTCVIEEGIAGASVRKIAARAGVQPSALHHYFAGRDEIIEEAVIHFMNRIFDDFQSQMASPGKDRLGRGMAFIFSKGMINDDYTGFFLECCVAARHNPRIRAAQAGLFAKFRSAIWEQLARVPGFEALSASRQSMLASIVVAIHEGIELQWFADPAAVRLDQALAVTRQIIDSFIQDSFIKDSVIETGEKTDP